MIFFYLAVSMVAVYVTYILTFRDQRQECSICEKMHRHGNEYKAAKLLELFSTDLPTAFEKELDGELASGHWYYLAARRAIADYFKFGKKGK